MTTPGLQNFVTLGLPTSQCNRVLPTVRSQLTFLTTKLHGPLTSLGVLYRVWLDCLQVGLSGPQRLLLRSNGRGHAAKNHGSLL